MQQLISVKLRTYGTDRCPLRGVFVYNLWISFGDPLTHSCCVAIASSLKKLPDDQVEAVWTQVG